MIQDIINALFEVGGGIAVLDHCWRLYRDKEVRGVSMRACFFFTAWGVWNIFYYPHLGQLFSFAGGIFVTMANGIYVSMLAYYSGTERLKWAVRDFFGGIVCMVKGHRYEAPYFVSGCLYFCARCNHELLGRTWKDAAPLTDEEREQLHLLDVAYCEGKP